MHRKLPVNTTCKGSPNRSFHAIYRLGLIVFISTAVAMALAGCGPGKKGKPQSGLGDARSSAAPYDDILESSYLTADILSKSLKKQDLPMNKPMLASSLVNIDNLNQSSTFGRLVSEQIASRLAQHGYPFVELKLRQDSVFIKEGQGEFLLSRELRHIGENHNAGAVLVGTYAVTENIVFVSVRLVRTGDNTVIAGHDYQLYNSDIVESLLY